MNFYPSLFEAATKYTERNQVFDKMVADFEDKYIPNKGSHERLKNAKNVSIDQFRKDVEDTANSLDIGVKSVTVIQPGRNNPKAKSDSFPTIHVELEDRTKTDFGLVLTALAGRNKTSTVFKEGLVCFFFGTNETYGPFPKTATDTEAEYFTLMENITNDIKKNGIDGIEAQATTEIEKELLSKSAEYDKDILNSVFNAMSIGNWLKNHPIYKNWEIHRDNFFDDIKAKGAKISGRKADKWNPMDILLIKKGKQSEISKIFAESFKTPETEKSLGDINNIFMDSLDSKNPKSLCLAISLKEELAQAGKAKSYVDNIELNDDEEYNLTPEEKEWFGDEDRILEEIVEQRKEIKDLADHKLKNEFDYKLGSEIDIFEGKNYLGKYGSLKMLSFLMNKSIDDPDLFLDLASFGLSLGVNPTFFKFVGNRDGDDKKIESHIVEFPQEGGVSLFDPPDGTYDGKIWIMDKPKNSGVDIIYWVEFSSWSYVVKVQIRSNQPVNKIAQVTVEINEFTKKKDLSR